MKIRNGFVSNSSSSSFVVIMKNGEKMTKNTLLETFDVKETSPLYKFAKDLASWMVNNLEERNIKDIHNDFVGNKKELSADEMIQEIIDDYGSFSKEDLEKVASKEYRYYYGSASNDSGYAIESYLYETNINIENDTIKIKGGY